VIGARSPAEGRAPRPAGYGLAGLAALKGTKTMTDPIKPSVRAAAMTRPNGPAALALLEEILAARRRGELPPGPSVAAWRADRAARETEATARLASEFLGERVTAGQIVEAEGPRDCFRRV
jgi:hypothetical protein